jgi:hypothetical protein
MIMSGDPVIFAVRDAQPGRRRLKDQERSIVSSTVGVGVVSEADPAATDFTTATLRDLRRRALVASDRYPSNSCVQYIVYVPSALVQPEFEGVRIGGYQAARRQVNVLIALPVDDTDLIAFLVRSLEQGLRLAIAHLEKRRVGQDLKPIVAATMDLIEHLRLRGG